MRSSQKKQQSDRLGDFLGYLQLYEEEGKCNIPLSQMRSRQKTVELCTTSNVPKVMEVTPLPDSPANTHSMTSLYLPQIIYLIPKCGRSNRRYFAVCLCR